MKLTKKDEEFLQFLSHGLEDVAEMVRARGFADHSTSELQKPLHLLLAIATDLDSIVNPSASVIPAWIKTKKTL